MLERMGGLYVVVFLIMEGVIFLFPRFPALPGDLLLDRIVGIPIRLPFLSTLAICIILTILLGPVFFY